MVIKQEQIEEIFEVAKTVRLMLQYVEKNQYSQALHYYKKAQAELNSLSKEVQSLHELKFVSDSMNDYSKLITAFLKKGKDLYKRAKEALENKDYNTAILQFNLAELSYQNGGAVNKKIECLLYIGECYAEQEEDMFAAFAYFNEALSVIRSFPQKSRPLEALEQKANDAILYRKINIKYKESESLQKTLNNEKVLLSFQIIKTLISKLSSEFYKLNEDKIFKIENIKEKTKIYINNSLKIMAIKVDDTEVLIFSGKIDKAIEIYAEAGKIFMLCHRFRAALECFLYQAYLCSEKDKPDVEKARYAYFEAEKCISNLPKDKSIPNWRKMEYNHVISRINDIHAAECMNHMIHQIEQSATSLNFSK